MEPLPNGFKLHKPILSSITNYDARQLSKSSAKASIWSPLLKFKEILNTKDGKLFDTKAQSCVCKFELFKQWLNIYKLLYKNKNLFKLNDYLLNLMINNKDLIQDNKNNNNQDNTNTSLHSLTYSNVKLASYNYQQVKLNVYKAFKQAALGSWVTKPFEQNQFDVNFDSI